MNHPTNLLWTGGWDSTFRLLNLVLNHKRIVQPYYLISSERQSSQVEVETMDKLKHLLFSQYPETRHLLLPTIYRAVDSILPHEKISRQFTALKATAFLGSQYDFIARFAHESNLCNLELSVHRDDHAQKFLAPYVINDNNIYRLRDDPSFPELSIFRYFHFPILDLTKRDMERLAKKHGFLNLLNQTVFCHNPRASGKPCGYCNPCRYTMEEGLARRIPLLPRLKFYIKRFLKKQRHTSRTSGLQFLLFLSKM